MLRVILRPYNADRSTWVIPFVFLTQLWLQLKIPIVNIQTGSTNKEVVSNPTLVVKVANRSQLMTFSKPVVKTNTN